MFVNMFVMFVRCPSRRRQTLGSCLNTVDTCQLPNYWARKLFINRRGMGSHPHLNTNVI